MVEKRSLYALLVCSLLFGLVLGAGVNEALFVMPAWFESPPASLSRIRELQLSWSRHVTLAVGWALVGGAIAKREVAS